MANQVIGIIDSGLGGLAIARAIWQRLPRQATIYLADHAFFPYGNKSSEEINTRLIKIVDWLITRNCRLIVIACNTITATAIDRLREHYAIPFVGTEPAVKLGGLVLATPTTASSQRYLKLARKYPVTTIACPGLAEAIEHGRSIRPFLPPLPQQTTNVVLGCTHYILVKDRIQKIYGQGVKIIDPSEAIARQTEKVLKKETVGKREFYTTGSFQKATKRATRLLAQRIIFSKCVL
jgi:glutamate racemase